MKANTLFKTLSAAALALILAACGGQKQEAAPAASAASAPAADHGSPLLPPVGVWAVSQSQCGRSSSQTGY